MILFCLPYAGGSEAIYYKWRRYLHPLIELYPVQLKGRGKRYDESLYDTFEEAVDDIFINIKDKISTEDYAIYGHSMGSLLAYELYYKIKMEKLKIPKHIFFSGYRAPSIIKKEEKIYMLPDYEFLQKIIELGGTPQELVNNNELLKMFLPIIRSDFKILDNYNFKKRDAKILCDVSVINGKQDSINLQEILAWKNHVCKGFRVYNLEGNHFFINDNIEKISNFINNTLIE